MKWCEQCQQDVGFIEVQVAADPHGLEYYELACEQCGAALAFVAVKATASFKSGPSHIYQRLLRGEVTAARYVAVVKRAFAGRPDRRKP